MYCPGGQDRPVVLTEEDGTASLSSEELVDHPNSSTSWERANSATSMPVSLEDEILDNIFSAKLDYSSKNGEDCCET